PSLGSNSRNFLNSSLLTLPSPSASIRLNTFSGSSLPARLPSLPFFSSSARAVAVAVTSTPNRPRAPITLRIRNVSLTGNFGTSRLARPRSPRRRQAQQQGGQDRSLRRLVRRRVRLDSGSEVALQGVQAVVQGGPIDEGERHRGQRLEGPGAVQ